MIWEQICHLQILKQILIKMIYIKEILNIPKIDVRGCDTLTFKNQVTHQIITLPVEDLTPDQVYYTFNIDISKFLIGQYDYYIYLNNEVVGSGIAQYGDFIPNITTYNREETDIKTYER